MTLQYIFSLPLLWACVVRSSSHTLTVYLKRNQMLCRQRISHLVIMFPIDWEMLEQYAIQGV